MKTLHAITTSDLTFAFGIVDGARHEYSLHGDQMLYFLYFGIP